MSGYVAADHSRDCAELARDLVTVLERVTAPAVRAADLLPHLHAIPGSSWAEWKPGRPLTAKGLSVLLAEMDAPRTAKLRTGGKGTPQYCFYSRAKLLTACRAYRP